MKKRVFGRYFSRSKKSRTALLRSLLRALMLEGKIKTTLVKAKVLELYAQKILAKAKSDDPVVFRRLLAETGNDREVVQKLIRVGKTVSGKKIKLIPLSPRRGDAALMARIELLLGSESEKKSETKSETEKTKKIKKSGKTEKKLTDKKTKK